MFLLASEKKQILIKYYKKGFGVMKMKPTTLGTIMVLIAATCFGISAPAAKVAYSEGASPVFMLAMRFTAAALILWVYNLVSGRRKEVMVTRKQLIMLFLIGGITYFATTILFFNAIIYIPVSLHVMVFYVYPFLINIFAVAILKEKMVPKQVVALIIAFLGIIMMVWAPGIYVNWFGVLLSVLAALCNGSYVLMLGSKYIEKLDSITVTTYISTFAAVSFLITSVLTNQIGLEVSAKGWGAILFIAVFTTVVATIALYLGIKEIGASRASIISTFEPVIAVLLGILMLGERLVLLQIIGGTLIIIAVVLVNMVKTDVSSSLLEEL